MGTETKHIRCANSFLNRDWFRQNCTRLRPHDSWLQLAHARNTVTQQSEHSAYTKKLALSAVVISIAAQQTKASAK